jgi:Dolichyl-phosphate-mannose-protein mannosyltransferase
LQQKLVVLEPTPACSGSHAERKVSLLNASFSIRRALCSRQALAIAGFVLLLITSVGLRVYRVNTYSLWLDEATQYQIAALPLKHMLCRLPYDWLVLPVLITKLQILTNFDGDAWQLRLPYVFFGILTVFTIFLLAQEMFSTRVAWLTAFLAAIWPRLIEYSQEMRPYALFVLLACISGFGLLRALRTNQTRYWILFAGAATFELYVHHLALLNVFSFFLFALVSICFSYIQSRCRGQPAPGTTPCYLSLVTKVTTAFLAIGVGFSSVLPFYLIPLGAEERRGILKLNSDAFETLGFYLSMGTGRAIIILVALALIGLAIACRGHTRTAIFALLWIFVPLLFATQHFGGERFLGSPRYLLFLVPVLLPFVAAGAMAISDAIVLLPGLKGTALVGRLVTKAVIALPYVILAGLVTPTLIALYSHNAKPLPVDLRSAYAYLLAHAKRTDVILGAGEADRWNPSWFPFTDGYFLRSKVATRRLETIPVRAEPRPPQPGAFPFQTVDTATGKLFGIIVTDRNKQSKLQQVSGDAFVSSCWEEVCVMESTSNLAMPLRLDDFLKRFAFVDPENFSALAKKHNPGNN